MRSAEPRPRGYHVIHLTDIKPENVPAFGEVKDKLKDQLLTEQAQKLVVEHGESFRNDIYEQPDNLQPMADKLKCLDTLWQRNQYNDRLSLGSGDCRSLP